MSIIKYLFYGVYNIIWIKFSIYVISFLNTYINSIFIPKSFEWHDNRHLRDDLTLFGISQFVIANVEGLLFLTIIYFINKWYLERVVEVKENNLVIANWTGVVMFIVMFVLIFRYFYFIYR